MGYFEKIYQADLDHRAKAVYMYLKDHADSEGKCWPGIRTIATELGISRSTVKRALNDLCKAEIISKEHRWRENGSLSSNLYRLLERKNLKIPARELLRPGGEPRVDSL